MPRKAARFAAGRIDPAEDAEDHMEYSRDELTEAKRQIDSTLHKLRETIKTLEAKENPARYRSQITLAKSRVAAFEIANDLIDAQLQCK